MATKFQFRATFASGSVIDASKRKLEGVSVITIGPALGHGVMIDPQSLETVKTCAEEYAGGLKVKVNHASGADAIVGRLNNFRIDGPQLRADLELLKNHPMTPLMIEMAEMMPESFGLSISFSGFVEETEDKQEVMRCLEIYSCDIVDQPAANPTGLFSVPSFDTTTSNMTFETPEYLELKATFSATQERFQKLTADFEQLSAERTDLAAKLEEATGKLTQAETANTELKAAVEKANADKEAAISDFDKKVGEKAAALLEQTGATPIKLGTNTGADGEAIYNEFKAADPVKARAMLTDPITGPIVRLESAKRHK